MNPELIEQAIAVGKHVEDQSRYVMREQIRAAVRTVTRQGEREVSGLVMATVAMWGEGWFQDPTPYQSTVLEAMETAEYFVMHEIVNADPEFDDYYFFDDARAVRMPESEPIDENTAAMGFAVRFRVYRETWVDLPLGVLET